MGPVVFFFRTGIILTLNKDDSLILCSLSSIRKIQHLSPTTTMKKYGQRKLPELWTAQMQQGAKATSSCTHAMAWPTAGRGTFTTLKSDPVEAAPGQETSPPPKWKERAQEYNGVVVHQVLAPREQADKWPGCQNSQVNVGGRRVWAGAYHPMPRAVTHCCLSPCGRTGDLRPGPWSVRRQF